jgi:hypothetical protein
MRTRTIPSALAALAQARSVTACSLLVVGLGACAGGERRFALRAPLTQDTDLRPVSLPCHPDPSPKDPNHVACVPDAYTSPVIWDGADNLVFRPLSESFAFEAVHESANANSLDEVADSSWFRSRIGAHPMTDDEVRHGACDPSKLIDPTGAEDGSWVIDKGKSNGSSPGFRVVIPGKGKFMFKSDGPVPEHASAASVVGAAIYSAAGYYTSCEQVVYFKPSLLKLNPGLRVAGNFDAGKPFDKAALDAILKVSAKRGDLVRFQASAWLPGRLVGPFRYQGTRDDDPNDVVPHEDRRELRGGRVLAAWIDHFDAREQNSMDTWIADGSGDGASAAKHGGGDGEKHGGSDGEKHGGDGEKHAKVDPDSSPGHLLHYYLDTSDALGSAWDWEEITRRLGFSYIVDWGDLGADFLTFGMRLRPWDRVKIEPGFSQFVYFDAKNFEPDGWKNEYPNRAFSRMTERDGAWMARILSRFSRSNVKALADDAAFTDPKQTEYLAEVLEVRLEKILERYLTRLSPIGDVRVEGTDQLCGIDFAEARAVREPERFAYRAHTKTAWLPVTRAAGGKVCATLTHSAPDGGPAADAPERYLRVVIDDGVAKGPLVAYLYDLGPAGGFRLAGLERPE